jgi:hypothetical protein
LCKTGIKLVMLYVNSIKTGSLSRDWHLKFSRGSPGTSEWQIFSCPQKNLVVPKSWISKAEFFLLLAVVLTIKVTN